MEKVHNTGTPGFSQFGSLRLFFLLLAIVFVSEAAVMLFIHFLPIPEGPAEGLTDASILTVIIAPFIWWLIVRPLRSIAVAENGRAEDIVANAIDGIISINEQGLVESFNPAAERIFGYSAEEMIGRNITRLMPSPYKEAHDKYIRDYLRKGEKRIFCRGREFEGVRKDGTRFPLEITVSEVRYGDRWLFTGILRDITERKRSEEALRESELKFRSVVRSAKDAIILADSRGKIISWNKSAQAIFGYDEKDVLGKPLVKLMPKRYRKAHKVGFGRYLATGKSEVIGKTTELFGLRENGHEFPLELSLASWKTEKGSFYCGIIRDISERKRTEKELQKAKVAAEDGNRAKSEFLANMSHEIRTPMNAIIGMTELALDTELTPEQRGYLNVVQSSSDGLLSLINDILDFSKIEAGQLEFEEVSFDLQDLIEGVAEILSVRAHEKDLELMCFVEPGLPKFVVGDPTRLRQILINLVGNAIKFTHKGEISIKVKPSKNSWRKQREEKKIGLHFEVCDTGIGISRENQDNIFAKFSQADSSTTRQFGGTGLGLCISKSLIEMMGGKIGVESEVGRGSTFHFMLNLPIGEGDSHEFAYPNFREISVLVVDDNGTNRFILRKTLSAWGLQVTEARGGHEALTLLKEAAAEFDLLILDYQMPELDGVEVVRAIRKNLRMLKTKIIMLSSWEGLNCKLKDELNIAATITKPVKQSKLFDVLMKVLRVNKAMETIHKPKTSAEIPGNQVHQRILLVEDNVDNQNLAKTILKKAGYLVDVAKNGKMAVEAAEKFRYDLILMDIQMPVMDGFEATQQIRSRERKQNEDRVPIIALTAHAIKGYREKCLKHGMDDHISKPIKKKVLLQKIAQWIDPRPTVLVVDDSEDNRNLLMNYLKKMKRYKLVFTQNGHEAVETFKRRTVSLLLMDMEMPVMDGYASTRTIRSLENGLNIPIIALSAHQGTREIRKCLQSGCTAVLTKPIRKYELLEALYQHHGKAEVFSENS
jgi:polar amino acid transport system substrate-binding protein